MNTFEDYCKNEIDFFHSTCETQEEKDAFTLGFYDYFQDEIFTETPLPEYFELGYKAAENALHMWEQENVSSVNIKEAE